MRINKKRMKDLIPVSNKEFQYPTVVGILGVGGIEKLIIVNAQRDFIWCYDAWQNIPTTLTDMFGTLKRYKSFAVAADEWLDKEAMKRKFLAI